MTIYYRIPVSLLLRGNLLNLNTQGRWENRNTITSFATILTRNLYVTLKCMRRCVSWFYIIWGACEQKHLKATALENGLAWTTWPHDFEVFSNWSCIFWLSHGISLALNGNQCQQNADLGCWGLPTFLSLVWDDVTQGSLWDVAGR